MMFKFILVSMLMIYTSVQHEKRTVLLFADNSSQGVLQKQQQLLDMDKQGLVQRDVEIKIYSVNDVSIWKQNHIIGGFTILLIGKDGGEKLRSHQPVTTTKLFNIIDAMPMRKEEMRHQGSR